MASKPHSLIIPSISDTNCESREHFEIRNETKKKNGNPRQGTNLSAEPRFQIQASLLQRFPITALDELPLLALRLNDRSGTGSTQRQDDFFPSRGRRHGLGGLLFVLDKDRSRRRPSGLNQSIRNTRNARIGLSSFVLPNLNLSTTIRSDGQRRGR